MKSSRIERLYWLAGWAYDFSRLATVLLVLVVVVNYFFFSVMVVRGASMSPTYVDGNIQAINRAAYEFGTPKRGDVVALRFPGEPNQRFVKRIIGLPGEKVAITAGNVTINDRLLIEGYLPKGVTTGPDIVRQLAPQ